MAADPHDATVPGGSPEWPVPLPDGLSELPPGADLAGILEEIPVTGVSGRDTVAVLVAAYRQACHARAVFLRALAETGMRRPGSADVVDRLDTPGEFASEEARAALVWSRRRSGAAFELAYDAFERLPMLGEAMLAGRLDEPRAVAFCRWTVGLTDDQAAQICAKLLPEAPGLMVGELIDRIKRLAIAIDPDWAERRYRQVVRGRRVVGSRNDDGSANVAGYDLPVDRAAAACDRIDTLARACKRAGDRRRIDHIRVDLFLGMLDGTFEEMADEEIIKHVLDHPFTDPLDPDEPSGRAGAGGDSSGDRGGSGRGRGPGGRGGDAGGGRGGSGRGRGPGGRGGDAGGGRGSTGPGREPAGGSGQVSGARGSAGPAGARSGAPTPDGAGSSRAAEKPSEPESPEREATGPSGGDSACGLTGADGVAWSVRELRVELTTLIGWDAHPGELPGWDFVPARLARHLAASMGSAQWRYVVCDAAGRPVGGGLIRARPDPLPGHAPPRRDSRRGGIVEIQVRVHDLDRMAVEPRRHGRWGPVIAEIARRSAVHTGVDSGAAGGSGSNAARHDAESARRRAPTAALRRDLQIRDRTCAHPACRAPAVGTDQDHAVDYARGGRTVAANLGACCRHDHRLRHDGGWRFHRPEPERAVWVSSLGHTYVSRPPPVIVSLPEPWPATVEDPLPADDGWVDQPGPLWEGGRKHSGAGTPEDVVGTPCGAAFDPEKDPPPF